MTNLLRVDMEGDIKRVLDANRFAVLATQKGGQPHTSLVAYTRVDGIRRLLFATYRATRKFESLLAGRRVALFIGDRSAKSRAVRVRALLTAHGIASEATPDKWAALSHEHKKRHPDLGINLASSEAALVSIDVTAFQLVNDIEDVRWFDLTDETT